MTALARGRKAPPTAIAAGQEIVVWLGQQRLVGIAAPYLPVTTIDLQHMDSVKLGFGAGRNLFGAYLKALAQISVSGLPTPFRRIVHTQCLDYAEILVGQDLLDGMAAAGKPGDGWKPIVITA